MTVLRFSSEFVRGGLNAADDYKVTFRQKVARIRKDSDTHVEVLQCRPQFPPSKPTSMPNYRGRVTDPLAFLPAGSLGAPFGPATRRCRCRPKLPVELKLKLQCRSGGAGYQYTWVFISNAGACGAGLGGLVSATDARNSLC